jgi:hypothetical protein
MAPRVLLICVACLLLLAISSVPTASLASSQCPALMQDFLAFNRKEAAPFTGANTVFFLHVPRTAGRTFHSCLLKLGTPASKRCPRAYDHLRIDFDVPNCALLSSHDDFSVVERLPPNTAVVSQLRDPVDRFLSAYEFAIEVAARQLRAPPRNASAAAASGKVMTQDVWPWSHLVPFFAADIKAKLAAVKNRMRAQAGGAMLWCLSCVLLWGVDCFSDAPAAAETAAAPPPPDWFF